jgi:hypothetical protein
MARAMDPSNSGVDSPVSALLSDGSGLGSATDSGYGNLTVHDGAVAAAIEGRSPTVASQTAVRTTDTFESVVSKLSTFGAEVNQAGIRYGHASSNSNAFAHQAVTVLGAKRPSAAVFAPGSDTELRY